MYEKASSVFFTTLILYIITLLTVSYVGVYLTYVAIPLIVISGLIMKFSKPNQQSQEIIDTTKSTMEVLENETTSFVKEIKNSLEKNKEKTKLINKKTKPLKDKLHKLEMLKLNNQLNNKSYSDIQSQITNLKLEIRKWERIRI